MRARVVWPAVAAIALAGLLFWRFASPGDAPAPPQAAPVPPPVASAPPPPSDPPGPARADAAPDAGLEPDESVFDASAMAWSQVDLDAVREALPENSYWERSAPTRDPELLRQREQERAYWEEQYGKVLSNTGSEEEVRAFYAHRQKLSTDAIEFSSYLLDRYGDVIPERDVGLLQLSLKLHYARLEQLPRDLSDALARREAHARAREEWLAQQRLFETEGSGTPEGD